VRGDMFHIAARLWVPNNIVIRHRTAPVLLNEPSCIPQSVSIYINSSAEALHTHLLQLAQGFFRRPYRPVFKGCCNPLIFQCNL